MKLKIFLIFFVVLIIPNVFSQVYLSLETTPDLKENTFYISKNISKEIIINLDSNYSSNVLYPFRAEYQLKNYSPLKEINMSLSKEEEYFISSLNSNLSLNIRSLNFQDQKIVLQVKVLLFDYYNNLVDSDYIYINLVSNNSEYEFSENIQNKVPEYKGYSLTRDKMIILNKEDFDKIIIKNHIDSIVYGTSCFSEEKINFTLSYLGNNSYSLEVFGNSDINSGSYLIYCKSFYKGKEYLIRPIIVNFFEDAEIVKEELINEDKEEIKSDNFLKNLYLKIKSSFEK